MNKQKYSRNTNFYHLDLNQSLLFIEEFYRRHALVPAGKASFRKATMHYKHVGQI